MTDPSRQADHEIIRALATRYAAAAADPANAERRQLWKDHLSLRSTRAPVLANIGFWDAWFGEWLKAEMVCRDPALHELERNLRWFTFLAGLGDDRIFEPWLTCGAVQALGWTNLWGVEYADEHLAGGSGQAFRIRANIETWDDLAKLRVPVHCIDEEATIRKAERWREALAGIVAVDVARTPFCTGFKGDISTDLARLRGLEQVMIDMTEAPEELHRLLAFMRDGILANTEEGARQGHWSLTSGSNQCQTYSHELPDPCPNSGPVPMNQVWMHVAAQEFTGVSPRMHERFLIDYQRPLVERYGLVCYGCCEDLTRKIGILRTIRNLRVIAVAPTADLPRCAAQIGTDYAMSWRPSPTDTVCAGWDAARVRRLLAEGLAATRGQHRHILLKDVHTVQGEPERVARFCAIAREEAERAGI